MLRALAGWKGYAAAAVAGAALLASAAKAEQRMAELEQFRTESQRLAGIAAELHATTSNLRAAAPGIIEAYTRETILGPLPADCVPGAGRLRVVNDAISAANAAAGAAAPCPPIPTLVADSWDAVGQGYARLVMLYGECAARHRAVVAAWLKE